MIVAPKKHDINLYKLCMAKYKGSFECFNPHCPYYLQFHKCNKRQFTPKGACKSCGQFSERGTCEAQKILEFPG